MNIWQKLFSIKNDNKFHKIITILGLKFKIKSLSRYIDYNLTNFNKKFNNYIYKEDYIRSCDYISPPFSAKENELEAALYNGLDDEAISNLSHILSINKKAAAISFFEKNLPDITSLYNEEEIKQIKEYKDLHTRIETEPNYFKYKNFKLPINFFAPEVFIYKHGSHKLKNLDYLNNKTIIDAGAFIGDSMIMFRDLFPNNQIISFEPSTKIYNLLLETIKLNNICNVKAENYALGDENKELYIDNTTTYPYISKTKSVKYCQEIKTITLDEYVRRNKINVGLIKTDVEGFEQALIKGAMETIKTQKPSMLISIYHNYDDFYKIKPMIESWDLGYRFDFFRGPDGKTTFGDTMLICEQPQNPCGCRERERDRERVISLDELKKYIRRWLNYVSFDNYYYSGKKWNKLYKTSARWYY